MYKYFSRKNICTNYSIPDQDNTGKGSDSAALPGQHYLNILLFLKKYPINLKCIPGK